MPTTTPIVLHLAEAAALLGMPAKRLYSLTRRRAQMRMGESKIPFFRLGKRIVFTRAALENWIAKLQEGAR